MYSVSCASKASTPSETVAIWNLPFTIRAGKELPVTSTEVFVRLRRPPQRIFDPIARDETNHVRFRIGPDVAVAVGVRAKTSGDGMDGEARELRLVHETSKDLAPYTLLLHNAMIGERELFARQDSVEAAWKVVDGVLDDVTPVHPYASGTWGPAEADALLPRGHAWHNPWAVEPSD